MDFIRQFKVDIGLIGIRIEADGTLRDFDYREVKVARAILDHSREVWLAADHSKFNRPAMVELARLDHLDRLLAPTRRRRSRSRTRWPKPACGASSQNHERSPSTGGAPAGGAGRAASVTAKGYSMTYRSPSTRAPSSRSIVRRPRQHRLDGAGEFRQIFPQPGWVEHDAGEIWGDPGDGGSRRCARPA